MFKYIVEVIEGENKNTYEFGNDYIKAVLFASKCKIEGLEAIVISNFISNL